MPKIFKSIFIILFLLFFCSTFVFAEDITFTTYYPSPYGSYRELRSQREGIGPTYSNRTVVCWDPPCPLGSVNVSVVNPSLLLENRVGIGTLTPDYKLQVRSDGLGTWQDRMGFANATADRQIFLGTYGINAVLAVHNFTLSQWRDLYLNTYNGTAGIVIKAGTGRVGIGTETPAFALDVIGQIRMSGASGLAPRFVLDIAEVIPVADDLEEGDVACIDNTVKKYQFAKSKTPDSLLVVGVISSTKKDGKSIPALFIGDAEQKQKDNPEQKYKYLAIAGQIAVKVCLEGGAIKKGDLLTSSSVSGYAMKSQRKQLGTLIGKALEDFDGKGGEKGIIIALLNLM